MTGGRISGAIALFALLPVLAAAGAGGQDYGNARFGYRIAIPGVFGPFSEADNGDGGWAAARLGNARLSVWGTSLLADDLRADAAARRDADAAEGWRMGYERMTRAFAVFSAARGARILYQRGMLGCPGQAIFFRIEYDAGARRAMDAVIEGLTRSFRVSCD